MEHCSKSQSNLNTLKSLTKKLNHLDHIKWYRRCKSLSFQQANTRSCCTWVVNRKHTYFFGLIQSLKNDNNKLPKGLIKKAVKLHKCKRQWQQANEYFKTNIITTTRSTTLTEKQIFYQITPNTSSQRLGQGQIKQKRIPMTPIIEFHVDTQFY